MPCQAPTSKKAGSSILVEALGLQVAGKGHPGSQQQVIRRQQPGCSNRHRMSRLPMLQQQVYGPMDIHSRQQMRSSLQGPACKISIL